MPIVGIDLGTTNSLIACFRNGRSELIPNTHGESLTPSVVSLLESGELIVGQAAKERLYTHPHLTAAAFKRFMGTKKQYVLGRKKFTAVELSALVIKSLKADAEAMLGERVEEAVISVPAYFNDQQRRATKQAGELAGLRVERLISEPTAAALAYGLHESDNDIKFLVFDLGGGTFDVSVVEMFENIMEVKAVAGDNFLGGEDFDQAIVDYFIEDQGFQALSESEQAIVKEKAETAKIALSSSDTTDIQVVLRDTRYVSKLTSSTFEEISKPIFARMRQPILRALRDAHLEPTDLAEVILVGGSSRMPLVRSFVEPLFGRLMMECIDPDEAVGIGAGVAAALKERNKELEERLMTDVCPYTLGTKVMSANQFGGLTDNVYLPIIERNTVIPCSKSVRLQTVTNNQRFITVRIYQGESRQADQNLELGELRIIVPPKPRGQAMVDARYTYDVNGLLEVEVTSLDTGLKERKVIINSENQLSEAEIKACVKKLASLKIHPRDKLENQLLLSRAERLYAEALGDMRAFIGNQTLNFEAVLDTQDPVLIKEAAQSFSSFLDETQRRL